MIGMAHYAFLDANNVVVDVIVGKDETDTAANVDWEQYYGEFLGLTCKRTSYNTFKNVHAAGKAPFRKNYAMIGGTYDPVRDAFIPIKPHASWVLDEDTCSWEAPTPMPDTVNYYRWNEETLCWDLDLPARIRS